MSRRRKKSQAEQQAQKTGTPEKIMATPNGEPTTAPITEAVATPITEAVATPNTEAAATPNDDPTMTPNEEPTTIPTVANEDNQIVQAPNNDEPAGTEIVLAEVFGEMIDATAEEPTYPTHEWQGPAEPPLVLPDEGASNESLIEGARRLVQIVGWRMRRTVQEWWLIGRHLQLLKARPENDGRWRTEILPEIGINHTTDHQLRTMAEKVPFEACGYYLNKSKLLREIGVLPPEKPKQLGGPQTDADGGNGARVRDVAEEIFGIETGASFGIEGLGDGSLSLAAPFDASEIQDGVETEPLGAAVADEVAQPDDQPDVKVQPKVEPKTKTDAKAKKVTAEAALQPEEDDPVAESDALVVTLGGAEVAELEAAAVEAGLIPIAKTEKRLVGLLWFGEEDHHPAKEKVGKTLDMLGFVKEKMQVEARYLKAMEVIAV